MTDDNPAGQVVGLDGKHVDPGQQPSGALLDIARLLLEDVIKGKVKGVILVTIEGDGGDEMINAQYEWFGRQVTLLGILERCKHKINIELDMVLRDE